MKATVFLLMSAVLIALFMAGCCWRCYQGLPASRAGSSIGVPPAGAVVGNRSVSPLAVLAAAGKPPSVAVRTRGVLTEGYHDVTLYKLPEETTNVTFAYRSNVEGAGPIPPAENADVPIPFRMIPPNSELDSAATAAVNNDGVMVSLVNRTGKRLHLWGQAAWPKERAWSDLQDLGMYIPDFDRPAFRMRDQMLIQYYAKDDEQREYLCEIFEVMKDSAGNWKGYRLLVQ